MGYCFVCGSQDLEAIDMCLGSAPAQEVRCPLCGRVAPTGDKFCGQCGTRLSAAATPAAVSFQERKHPTDHDTNAVDALPETAGERREVTVLFADVNNFTATAHELDNEETFLIIDEALRLLAEVVDRYEGTVDKFTGDGLMALFGAPYAHEDDPQRALRAALEMQTVLQPLQERLRRERGIEFQIRIGVNTGTVVAGQIGSGWHTEYTVIGHTVNLAARLQAAAQAGTIVVSSATYLRTCPLFQFEALPPMAIKGLPRPIQVYRLLGPQERPGSLRGLPGLEAPMIGRGDALAKLHKALATASRQRRSQTVLITGAAGVGKSRLVTEFRRSLSQPNVAVYEGSCVTPGRSRPLWVVAELLRDMLHLPETTPAHLQRDALRNYLAGLGLDSATILPYVANVLGLAHGQPELEALLRPLDASTLQAETHRALRQLFLAEAGLGPTVLVFEDLHWVDPFSRDFLVSLTHTTVNAALLILLVSRDTERQTVLQPLITAARKSPTPLLDIKLRELSEAEGQLLVHRLLSQTTSEVEAIKAQIARRAEGNPFYTEEIIRMLIERGGLTGGPGNWHVTPRAAELLEEVPETLKGLLLVRFDRLPGELRHTLQKAAVLGRSFPVSLLLSLNGTRPEVLARQLDELADRQFLVVETCGPEPSYAFRHVLIQEAVYSTLLNRQRQLLHEAAARAVKCSTFWPPEEQAEVLAYHYAQSSDPSLAVPFLMTAANNAARRTAAPRRASGSESAVQCFRHTVTVALMHGQLTARPAPCAVPA